LSALEIALLSAFPRLDFFCAFRARLFLFNLTRHLTQSSGQERRGFARQRLENWRAAQERQLALFKLKDDCRPSSSVAPSDALTSHSYSIHPRIRVDFPLGAGVGSCYDHAMRTGSIPFQFDITDLLKRARRIAGARVGNVTLSLPFVSIAVHPKDRERQIAREIVIRLKDRRVLSAWECCNDCIERALASLLEIRRLLVEKQVELKDFLDGPLFLLVDTMSSGIRQFLTFEERLSAHAEAPRGKRRANARRHFGRSQQDYFDALEVLRGHLSRYLGQVAAIARMELPNEGVIAHYQGAWQLEAYKPPAMDEKARVPRKTA
jgi:hypothetical protein